MLCLSIYVKCRESRFPDRGRKCFFLVDRLRLALWVEKVDSPIGDENSFLYVHCFLPSVEKVDSPIGDEKQSDICYDFLRKVEKVDSPIGDEKSVFVMVLLSISSVEKVDSPIGDENSSSFAYFTVTLL